MTALDRYVRLESDALWRETPDGQLRNVVVSFGDATLVIADGAGRPLSHWSLPAAIRQNPKALPAIYSPDEDGFETLEIADETMVEAIEIVQDSLAAARPKPGRLRYILTLLAIGLVALLGVFWLPDALTRQTLDAIPDAKRRDIGRAVLEGMEARTGTRCTTPEGEAAANQLARRLFGPQSRAQIVVLPRLPRAAVLLPGQIVVLDAAMLARASDLAAAAGFVLAAGSIYPNGDPLEPLLREAGISATLRLLTRGMIPPSMVSSAVDAKTAIAPIGVDAPRLANEMAAAMIPQGPFLSLIDKMTGSMPDLGSDPHAGQQVPLILSDGNWISLQNICL